MGIFSNLKRSWNKSARIEELQKRVSPPNQSISDMVASIHQARGDTPTSHNQALEDYLDFCQEDSAIQQVMQIEGLSRDDLKQLHARLLTAGLGRWVNGHNMALSTLAYTEPLQFAVRAPKIGMPWGRSRHVSR